MNLTHLIQTEAGPFGQLCNVLQDTFIIHLDDQDRLLSWNRTFARLFPGTIDLKGTRLDELLVVPKEESDAIPASKELAPQAHVLRLKHANHYFRCVALPASGGTLMCGERLQHSENQVLNSLSQLTNEMAGMNMQLVQKHRELKAAYGKIQQISRTDPLTELPNRRCFMERFQGLLDSSVPRAQSFALVLFDLDHFKQINDQFGHDAGDQVLRNFAELLKKHSRKSDLPARFGGEEFIELLPNTTIEEANVFAERIRSELAAQRLLNNDHLITVSAGVCGYTSHLSREELIKQADVALYAAKNLGRNRVMVFSPRL
jgi:diguanylate cyclase (GGDEF)-like protein